MAPRQSKVEKRSYLPYVTTHTPPPPPGYSTVTCFVPEHIHAQAVKEGRLPGYGVAQYMPPAQQAPCSLSGPWAMNDNTNNGMMHPAQQQVGSMPLAEHINSQAVKGKPVYGYGLDRHMPAAQQAPPSLSGPWVTNDNVNRGIVHPAQQQTGLMPLATGFADTLPAQQHTGLLPPVGSDAMSPVPYQHFSWPPVAISHTPPVQLQADSVPPPDLGDATHEPEGPPPTKRLRMEKTTHSTDLVVSLTAPAEYPTTPFIYPTSSEAAQGALQLPETQPGPFENINFDNFEHIWNDLDLFKFSAGEVEDLLGKNDLELENAGSTGENRGQDSANGNGREPSDNGDSITTFDDSPSAKDENANAEEEGEEEQGSAEFRLEKGDDPFIDDGLVSRVGREEWVYQRNEAILEKHREEERVKRMRPNYFWGG